MRGVLDGTRGRRDYHGGGREDQPAAVPVLPISARAGPDARVVRRPTRSRRTPSICCEGSVPSERAITDSTIAAATSEPRDGGERRAQTSGPRRPGTARARAARSPLRAVSATAGERTLPATARRTADHRRPAICEAISSAEPRAAARRRASSPRRERVRAAAELVVDDEDLVPSNAAASAHQGPAPVRVRRQIAHEGEVERLRRRVDARDEQPDAAERSRTVRSAASAPLQSFPTSAPRHSDPTTAARRGGRPAVLARPHDGAVPYDSRAGRPSACRSSTAGARLVGGLHARRLERERCRQVDPPRRRRHVVGRSTAPARAALACPASGRGAPRSAARRARRSRRPPSTCRPRKTGADAAAGTPRPASTGTRSDTTAVPEPRIGRADRVAEEKSAIVSSARRRCAACRSRAAISTDRRPHVDLLAVWPGCRGGDDVTRCARAARGVLERLAHVGAPITTPSDRFITRSRSVGVGGLDPVECLSTRTRHI